MLVYFLTSYFHDCRSFNERVWVRKVNRIKLLKALFHFRFDNIKCSFGLVKTLTRWNISVIYGEINSHVDFPQGISDLVKKKNCSKRIYDREEKLSNSDYKKTWMW